MRALYIILLMLPCLASAQARSRAIKDSLFNKMMFYSSTIESTVSPDSVSKAIFLVKMYQENRANNCNYTLYIFKPIITRNFFVKKFAVKFMKDTVVTDFPLFELPSKLSNRMDDFLKKSSTIIPKPFSTHYQPTGKISHKLNYSKPKDYWQIEVVNNLPGKQFKSVYQQNSSDNFVINRGFVFAIKKKLALNFLRKSMRDFTFCQ